MHVLDRHIAAAQGCEGGEARHLDVVRAEPIAPTVEMLDTLDAQHVRPDALDLGAKRDQEAAQVLDVRLARCVADDGLAAGEHRGHDGILGPHHRRLVEVEARADQAAFADGQLVGAVQLDLDSERGERVDVRVEAAATDHVPTGWWHDDAPKRARSGPASRKEALMRRHSSGSSDVFVTLPASTVTSFGPLQRTSAPMSASSSTIVSTSMIRGTFSSRTGPDASTVAARIGSAPFLFPAARTVPDSGRPPSITNDSMRRRYGSDPMDVTRERAWTTLTQYTKSESLLRHALAVEASVRFYARFYGEDEELWGAVGLLHDFDYELHPTLDKHPQDGAPILRQEGYPEIVIDGVLSHAEHLALPRDTQLKKVLFACDELSGFVHACGLVRPTGLDGLEPKSVKKKLKQPSFAAGVHREEVYAGAELLELELDDHITNVITALQPLAPELGLRTAADA